jgi:heat shock protein HslJ
MSAFKVNSQSWWFIIAVAGVALLLGLAAVFMGDGQMPENEATVPENTEKTEAPAPAAKPAAKKPAPVVAPSAPRLNGLSFRLASHNGYVVPEGTNYTLSFETGSAFEDGIIRAKFCNGMNGPYEVEGNVINSKLAGTRMFCNEPAGIMEAEGQFGDLLGGGAKATLLGSALTLTNGVTTMVFIRQ